MSTPPRTAKEALLAEMLGDMDNLLTRIENLPQLIENCEKRLSAAATTLESAGEKYGQAVSSFTNQAKGELTGFLEKESVAAIERQIAVTQKAAHASSNGPGNIRLFSWRRFLEYMCISLFTVFLTIFFMHFTG